MSDNDNLRPHDPDKSVVSGRLRIDAFEAGSATYAKLTFDLDRVPFIGDQAASVGEETPPEELNS